MASGANNMLPCKICGSESPKAFTATVLTKHTVNYYSCPQCEFLFTEEPYWLDEAYQRTINREDTGIMYRNIYYSRLVSVYLFFLMDKKGKYLDYAGGYGIFTRLMRDIGFDFYWYDPFCENLLAPGFERPVRKEERYEGVTAFEVFEHLRHPVDEIKTILGMTDTLIFSTELQPHKITSADEWWYLGLEHGQHIAFYSKKTFAYIAKYHGLHFYSCAGMHVLSRKMISPKIATLVLRLTKVGLSHIVQTIMPSKTWEDHKTAKTFRD